MSPRKLVTIGLVAFAACWAIGAGGYFVVREYLRRTTYVNATDGSLIRRYSIWQVPIYEKTLSAPLVANVSGARELHGVGSEMRGFVACVFDQWSSAASSLHVISSTLDAPTFTTNPALREKIARRALELLQAGKAGEFSAFAQKLRLRANINAVLSVEETSRMLAELGIGH